MQSTIAIHKKAAQTALEEKVRLD